MKKFLYIQFFQTCIICWKDKQKKDAEMTDIEPSIQFESLSDRINIFPITQTLTNINSLVNDLSSQPRLQNLLAAAVTKGTNRQLSSQTGGRAGQKKFFRFVVLIAIAQNTLSLLLYLLHIYDIVSDSE